jgi:hypothetical protein
MADEIASPEPGKRSTFRAKLGMTGNKAWKSETNMV